MTSQLAAIWKAVTKVCVCVCAERNSTNHTSHSNKKEKHGYRLRCVLTVVAPSPAHIHAHMPLNTPSCTSNIFLPQSSIIPPHLIPHLPTRHRPTATTQVPRARQSFPLAWRPHVHAATLARVARQSATCRWGWSQAGAGRLDVRLVQVGWVS